MLAAGATGAANTFDEADAVDPFQEMEHMEMEEQMLPPEEDEAPEAPQPNPEAGQAQQPVPMVEEPRQSWWQRVGETVAQYSLVVGGASIHHSHLVGAFGNTLQSIVFCARCGGSTQGSFSPLLAEPCRRQASETRQRQLNRMLGKHQWPVGAMQSQFGRGVLSPPIGFAVVGEGNLRIVEPGTQSQCAQVDRSANAGDSDR